MKIFMHPYKLTNLIKYHLSKRIKKKAKKEFKIKKEAFINYIENKQIKDKWFLNNFEVFNYFLPKDENKKFSYLEIGSYEGLSALNVLNFYKNIDAKLVDIWDFPHFNSEPISTDFDVVEKNFDFNLKEFNNFEKIKKDSLVAMRHFIKEKIKFDYIYIDGSHNGEDVISDAVESFKVLKKDGIIIFDDAMHPHNDSIKYQAYDGLYYFLRMFKKEIKILYFQNILVLQKI